MFPLPALVQTEAPSLPPGWRGMERVSSRVISVEGTRVAKVALWVDLPALRRAVGPGEASGLRARQCLAEGRVRVLALSTYLVDIGPQRRRARLEGFFAAYWPEPGADLSRRPVLLQYLSSASQPIAMGDVQARALEPGKGLWYLGRSRAWQLHEDRDLGLAWAKGELGVDQDRVYAEGLELDLSAALGRQSAR